MKIGQTGQSVSEQVKIIGQNNEASTELLKRTTTSQIKGPASNTFNENRNSTSSVHLSPIFETKCLYFSLKIISHH